MRKKICLFSVFFLFSLPFCTTSCSSNFKWDNSFSFDQSFSISSFLPLDQIAPSCDDDLFLYASSPVKNCKSVLKDVYFSNGNNTEKIIADIVNFYLNDFLQYGPFSGQIKYSINNDLTDISFILNVQCNDNHPYTYEIELMHYNLVFASPEFVQNKTKSSWDLFLYHNTKLPSYTSYYHIIQKNYKTGNVEYETTTNDYFKIKDSYVLSNFLLSTSLQNKYKLISVNFYDPNSIEDQKRIQLNPTSWLPTSSPEEYLKQWEVQEKDFRTSTILYPQYSFMNIDYVITNFDTQLTKLDKMKYIFYECKLGEHNDPQFGFQISISLVPGYIFTKSTSPFVDFVTGDDYTEHIFNYSTVEI